MNFRHRLVALGVLLLWASGPLQASSIVLLRTSTTVGGKSVPTDRATDANRQLRYFLARIDGLEAPRRVRPTPVPAAPGWLQLTVSEGSHFLLVLPPGVEQNPPAVAYSIALGRYGRLTDYALKQGRGGFWSAELGGFVFAGDPPADFKPLHGYWLDIPGDAPLVYGGSLSVECKGGRGLFGSLIDSCGDIALADQTTAARELAAQAFPGRAVTSRVLVPYGELARSASSQDTPTEGEAAASGEDGGRAQVVLAPTTVTLGSGAALHGVGPAINLYNLLVVGGELRKHAADLRRARDRQLELQGCLDRLSATAGTLELAQQFAQALPAGRADMPRRWTVGLALLRLRAAPASQDMALELGLALKPQSLGEAQAAGHVIVVSGPDMPVGDPHASGSPLYLQWVPEAAAARPVTEWCGEQGTAILAAEVEAAVGRIAAFAAGLRTASPVP